jgi:ABC-type dipeptide/oligopeptide/nickel transport system permease component
VSVSVFVVRRVLWTIPVLLLVILFTFLLVRAIATGPFSPENQPRADQVKFHLDEPWYEQYAFYVKSVFTLDFGPSRVYPDRTVNEILKEQYPNSLLLGLLALAWAVGIGIPAGVIAALRPGSARDYTVMLLSSVGFALPSFFVATLLIYYVAVKLDLVPTSGWPSEHWQLDRSVILPSIALSLMPMAWFARLTRGAMLETMGQDYVRVARAKGLRSEQVILRHVLKNSLVPLVTAAGPIIGALITGSFVIEWIFSIPGIGRYFIGAAFARDYFVLLGITIVLSLTIIVANLLVDLAYFILDPRTREASLH